MDTTAPDAQTPNSYYDLDQEWGAGQQHERVSKLVGTYTAFIAAVLVAVLTKGDQYPHSWIIIVLLAPSIPSLVALFLLDLTVRVGQSREKSTFRGLAIGLGFFPSLLGVGLLLCHFSVTAGILFLLLTAFWLLAILIVADLGRDPRSLI